MIFLTRKDFEEAVNKRVSEIRFGKATEEELWDLKNELTNLKAMVNALKNELINLKAMVNALENAAKNPSESDKIYEPAPYWTNPNWTGPDITCHVVSRTHD